MSRAVDPLDNWTWRNQSGTTENLQTVAYGNDRFVAMSAVMEALGNSGSIWTSTDGVNWTEQQSGGQLSGTAVAFGNGQFVALNGGTILVSVDGKIWERQQVTPASQLGGITFADGEFVAVGEDSVIFASEDGTNWTQRLAAVKSELRTNLTGIAYGNHRLVAVGGTCAPRGCGGTVILSSDDGMTWIPREVDQVNGLAAIAYGNGRFVAVGSTFSPSSASIITSADGIGWVPQQFGSDDILAGITYGGGQFVAVGIRVVDSRILNSTILTSPDGRNWIRRECGAHILLLNHVVYGDGRFVVVGENGIILQSGPISHLSVTPDLKHGLLSLSLEGPTGLNYAIQSSADLISWHDVTKITNAPSEIVITSGLPAASSHQFYRATSQ